METKRSPHIPLSAFTIDLLHEVAATHFSSAFDISLIEVRDESCLLEVSRRKSKPITELACTRSATSMTAAERDAAIEQEQRVVDFLGEAMLKTTVQSLDLKDDRSVLRP